MNTEPVGFLGGSLGDEHSLGGAPGEPEEETALGFLEECGEQPETLPWAALEDTSALEEVERILRVVQPQPPAPPAPARPPLRRSRGGRLRRGVLLTGLLLLVVACGLLRDRLAAGVVPQVEQTPPPVTEPADRDRARMVEKVLLSERMALETG